MTSAGMTRLFPLWAVLASLLAWRFPELFTPLKPAILPLLASIMFCMGLSLRLQDFTRVLRMPRLILSGLLLQYSIMPLTAFLVIQLFQLDPMLAVGMILVGASPGGTASNVICYLARANVALSISLTSLSTLLSIFLTPWLSWFYIDASIDVPTLDMLKSILILVIAPVSLGVLLNQYFHSQVQRISADRLSLLAVMAIVLIIAIVIALNAERLYSLSAMLLLAVVIHNLTGLATGFGIARLLGASRADARTLAIETGMQNSGLAVALAIKYFSPAAALPGAVFSVWHNLSGSLLASYWRSPHRKPSA